MQHALPASILCSLIEETGDAVLVMDAHCRIRYVNRAMSKLSGYCARELLGKSLNILLPASVAAVHDRYVSDYLAGTRQATVLGHVRELELRHRGGQLMAIEIKAVDLGMHDGNRYCGGFIVDISSRKTMEARNAALLSQLKCQALTDELTGLPNRRAFELQAAHIVAHASRGRHPLTVGVIDIDRFKEVNDRFGHSTGDLVLRHVAQLIQQSLRAEDLCCRLGGEEFGLLLPNATAAQAEELANRIRTRLAEEGIVLLSGSEVNVKISCGLAELGTDVSLGPALSQADAALYQAKLTGRDRVVVAL
jgi:diguanylate cyclase (GGDEF)-like protein/PAS domain S-box-containing protein